MLRRLIYATIFLTCVAIVQVTLDEPQPGNLPWHVPPAAPLVSVAELYAPDARLDDVFSNIFGGGKFGQLAGIPTDAKSPFEEVPRACKGY